MYRLLIFIIYARVFDYFMSMYALNAFDNRNYHLLRFGSLFLLIDLFSILYTLLLVISIQ